MTKEIKTETLKIESATITEAKKRLMQAEKEFIYWYRFIRDLEALANGEETRALTYSLSDNHHNINLESLRPITARKYTYAIIEEKGPQKNAKAILIELNKRGYTIQKSKLSSALTADKKLKYDPSCGGWCLEKQQSIKN